MANIFFKGEKEPVYVADDKIAEVSAAWRTWHDFKEDTVISIGGRDRTASQIAKIDRGEAFTPRDEYVPNKAELDTLEAEIEPFKVDGKRTLHTEWNFLASKGIAVLRNAHTREKMPSIKEGDSFDAALVADRTGDYEKYQTLFQALSYREGQKQKNTKRIAEAKGVVAKGMEIKDTIHCDCEERSCPKDGEQSETGHIENCPCADCHAHFGKISR